MKFCILHATARVTPDYDRPWWAAATGALGNCDHPETLEYILVVHHSRMKEFWEHAPMWGMPWGKVSVVTNYGRDCIVDQSNAGRAAATGEIIMGIQDDLVYPPHWDTEVLRLIPDTSKRVFVKVRSDGYRDLMIPELCTRSLFLEAGAFSPEYESMFADNDWSERVKRIGGIIEAPHLYFQHLHPIHGTAEADDIYELQNRKEAYDIGRKVFARRQALGFPRVPLAGETEAAPAVDNGGGLLGRAASFLKKQFESIPVPQTRNFIACMPGEDHERITNLFQMERAANEQGFAGFTVIAGYTSSPDVTRISMAETALDHCAGNPATPYVFWMDDDNLIAPEQLKRLIAFLDAHPQTADIVVGWCWIRKGNEWTPSVGAFTEEMKASWFTVADLLRSNGEPFLVDGLASGFPCVMMRREVLERLGPRAFCRIPVPEEIAKWGFLGEDFSFFWRAKAAGFRCWVDPQCKVPHIKPTAQEPHMLLPPGAAITPEVRAWLEQVNGTPLEMPVP